MPYRRSIRGRTRFKSGRLLGVFAIAFGLCILTPAASASAQSQCGDRGELVTILSERFGESPVAGGLSRAGTLIEVFSSGSGDTWSLVVTTPDGVSCLIDAGGRLEKAELRLGRIGGMIPMSHETIHAPAPLERVAREVAAGLSPAGEDDWRQYVALARQIETRINWQLLPLMVYDDGGDPIP